MNPLLRFLATIPAFLFIASGLNWVINPESAADAIGMPLLDGIARSSQIGDTGAFFMGCGLMMVLGLIRKEKIWLQAPAIIIALAIIYRTLATLLHGAPFAGTFVAIEAISVILLFVAAKATR